MVPLARRSVLLGGALAGVAGLSGCAGVTRRVSSTRAGDSTRLTVQVYGTETETAVYAELARAFGAERRVEVDLTVVPFSQVSTGLDAGLISGTAPDVFRIDYPSMGLYASTAQLLDVTDALDELSTDVPAALMDAVTFGERRFGIPQHVDTSAVLYRPDVLAGAGISSVPERPEDAWSWEEFGQVADTLRDRGPEGLTPFAVNWQAAGAFRWLNWLFMAGGQLYDEDRTRSTLDTEAGRRALDFTRSFFDRGWVPASTSTKSATYPDSLFVAGRLSMVFAGNFLLPALADSIGDRFEYGVTYLPQDQRRAGELGGNAIVANAAAAAPDLAAEFLVYLASPEAMTRFCAESVSLPTRESLGRTALDYSVAGDLMGVYTDQITTITARDVADVTAPTFGETNVDLANELEECFLGGRGSEETLAVLADRLDATAALNDEGSPRAAGAPR